MPAVQLAQTALTLPDPTTPGLSLPTVRATTPLLVVWLVLVWMWNAGGTRCWTRTAATAVLWTGLTAMTLVVVGQPGLEVLQECAATLLQAVTTLVVYRWAIGDDNLVPHRPGDVTSLFVASLVGALLGAPVAPGVLGGSSGLPLATWVVLGTAYTFVGVACLLLLIERRPRDEAIATRLFDVNAMVLVTAFALAVDLAFPGYSLSWLMLLPAVWAGLLLGPWATAAFCLATCTAVITAQTATAALVREPLTAVNLLLVAALMAAFVLIAMLLSLVRDQRAHLSQEVTQRRQEALDQAGLLETLLGSIDEALVLLDRRGAVQLHNRAAVALLGADRLPTEAAKWLRSPEELPARFSYTFQSAEGDESGRILSVHVAAVQYAGADGTVAVVRDVTHEHRRLEELASFAAVAAHDLKSPLAAVQGWLEVAEEVLGDDPERALHAVRRGRGAAGRMTSEIDDWLAYTVAREGELNPERVVVVDLLHEIAATHAEAEFDFVVDHAVLADKVLLRHLLANLVGNAVKYARAGERPWVRVETTRTETGWVQLQVVDRGIGIPAGEEKAVFEPFRRASTVQGTYQGSGLGLALCKRIVRRHGGAISATRNDAQPGTTITLTLPAERVSALEEPAAVQPLEPAAEQPGA